MKKVLLIACGLLMAVMGVRATDWTGAEKVTIKEIDVMTFYPQDSDWWIYLHGERVADAEPMDFNFDIRGPKTGLADGKVYPWKSMLTGIEPGTDDFCFAVLEGTYYQYDDADFRLRYGKAGQVDSILAHVSFDGKTYELTYVAPVVIDTVEMSFTDGRIYRHVAEQQTRYDGWDSTKEYNLSIMLKNADTEGSYQWSDINQTFTYMKQFLPAKDGEEAGEVKEFVFFDANVDLTETASGCMLDAYMLCTDGKCYHCILECPIPKAEQTVEFEAAEMLYYADNRESDGFGYFRGFTNGELCINLAIFPHPGKGLAGHYTETDLEELYSMVQDANGQKVYEIYSADILVERDSIGGWALSGSLLCFNNTEYVFSMACAGEYAEDDDEKELDFHFMNTEVFVMDQYLASNNVLSLLPTRRDKYAALIEFNVADGKAMQEAYLETEVYNIAAGVYPINDSGAANTVSSSFGIVNGEPQPSYACRLMGADQIESPFWFFVSGTVTVSYVEGSRVVEVNALNSFGKKVHILIDDNKEQGVENVMVNECATKVLRGGDMIIRTEKSEYNISGQKL